MFKSLFRRKKSDPERTNEPNDSQGTDAQQQHQHRSPIDEVLHKLCEDLDPWDCENYSENKQSNAAVENEQPDDSGENEQSDDVADRASVSSTKSLATTNCMGTWFGEVTVAEAQYLWARYKQLLQGNDKLLTDDVLRQEPFASNYLLQQIWKTIPRDENGYVTFPSFFGVIKWWQTVDQETKLRGIFKLMNKAQPIDAETLKLIFLKLDTTQDKETASKQADLLISHLDTKNQGFIDEEQWLQALSRFSDEEIDDLTKVNAFPMMSESPSQVLPSPSPCSPVPEDILVTITSKIGERDWKPLANKLGFNEKEIKLIQRQYPNRSREQTFQMLRNWSEKEGATKEKLDFALRRCGMDDVLFTLQNE